MSKDDAKGGGGLQICDARRAVRFAGREARLPDLSFRLLRLLGEGAPEPVSFAEIEARVWNAQVSRETIKQRAKMLRDSLADIGLADGVQSARNVGYRLTRPLGTYADAGPEVRSWRSRGVVLAAVGLAAAVVVGGVILLQAGARAGGDPLLVAVRSEAGAPPPGTTPAWDSARRLLIRDLSRLDGVKVVASAAPEADLVVAMAPIVADGREALALELVERDSGVVIWAETYPRQEAGWDRAVSHFVALTHGELETLGRRLGPEGFARQPARVRELYLGAATLARSGTAADLQAAAARLESALALRPRFAQARALRAEVNARRVIAHGAPPALARAALEESRALVADHPDVPEFRRALATAQIANGDLRSALETLEIAQRDLPFLRRDILALERRLAAGTTAGGDAEDIEVAP